MTFIRLPATPSDDLDWSEQRSQANFQNSISWYLDLGLFNRLEQPLANQTQFLSLTLALHQFRDTLWQEFQHKTEKVYIYRGPLDWERAFKGSSEHTSLLKNWIADIFSSTDQFIQETDIVVKDFSQVNFSDLNQTPKGQFLRSLYWRDTAADYLQLLAANISDEIPLALHMDGSMISDSMQAAQLMASDTFNRYQITTTDLPFRLNPEAPIGIYLPTSRNRLPNIHASFQSLFNGLNQENLDYRLISEEQLIYSWDGLDILYAVDSALSFEAKRQIKGFEAAGGTVILR